MNLTEKLKYLFSKINFSASFLDAKAIEIYNSIESDVEKTILETKLELYKKLANKIELIRSGELDINEYAEEVHIKILGIDTKIDLLVD